MGVAPEDCVGVKKGKKNIIHHKKKKKDSYKNNKNVFLK